MIKLEFTRSFFFSIFLTSFQFV